MSARAGLLRYPGDVTGGDRARVGRILGHTDPPDVVYWEVTDAEVQFCPCLISSEPAGQGITADPECSRCRGTGKWTEIGLMPAGRESQLMEILELTRQANLYERLMRVGLIRPALIVTGGPR